MIALAEVETVKEVAAVRAVTTRGVPTRVAKVELHVVPLMVTESSTCRLISLFAVTAVEFTTSVLPVPVGKATAPMGALPQTAGDAPFAQFETVLKAGT